MEILLLSLVTVGVSWQNIFKKSYNERSGNRGALIFSAVSVLFAGVFFLFSSGFALDFRAEIVPYSIAFAISYGMAVLMSLLSIKVGSLSLTSLVTSYSLIIPTFYGIFFMGEEGSVLFYVGLAILMVSLFLMNSKRTETKATLVWVIFVFLAFASNGICSTVQMVQQKDFGGLYKSEMMITSLLAVAVVLAVTSVFVYKRDEISFCLKRGYMPMILCGVVNGACNLMVMMLVVKMNASVMYPIISAGGIIITGAVSRFIYKEKLSKSQYAALLLGIVSVVLMNV